MQNQEKYNPGDVYYPDVIIFLISIPVISAINYHLTYSNIQFNWFLALTYTIDTVQGYVAWWAVRSFIIYLDRVFPVDRYKLKRIVFQVLTTTVIGLFMISITTEIISFIVKNEWAPLDFYTIDLVIISIWFFVINGVYIGLYYRWQWRLTQHKIEEENKKLKQFLLVKKGINHEVKISYPQIAAVTVDNEVTFCETFDGTKHILDQTLNELEEALPSSLFFRINRQYIIHRDKIQSFEKVENGKLNVVVSSSSILPAMVGVSRLKAPAFKKWLKTI